MLPVAPIKPVAPVLPVAPVNPVAPVLPVAPNPVAPTIVELETVVKPSPVDITIFPDAFTALGPRYIALVAG